MHLALSLGKTKDELLTGQKKPLSNDELNEWIAFARLHPLPNSWEQTALQCSTNVKIHCNKDIDIYDFMPVSKPEIETTLEEQKSIIERFCRKRTK